MNILINKAHYPVKVLGYGNRIGIWLQGCSIRCPSCCSLDTWEFSDDRGMDVDSLIGWCREVAKDSLDGITISGGEPFDQPLALLTLLKSLCDWRDESRRHFDVLVYTGYSEQRLKRDFSEQLLHVDAMVVGPFKESASGQKPYCGSDNQQMVVLTEVAKERYGSEGLANWNGGIQATADDEGIWMVGIPMPGDLEEFESGCEKRGLILGMPSWRC